MIYLDTSSLIRFFTKDNFKKALAVKKLLEQEDNLFIPEVVFPELEYVLEKGYKESRRKILIIYKFLLSRSNIKLTLATKQAIDLFGATSLDMADCLIVVHSLKGKLASFDRKLLAVKGVKRYW